MKLIEILKEYGFAKRGENYIFEKDNRKIVLTPYIKEEEAIFLIKSIDEEIPKTIGINVGEDVGLEDIGPGQ